MHKPVLILFLLFVSALLLNACGRYTNDPLWNEVTAYFTNPARTKREIFSRISPEAMQYVVKLSSPGSDSARVVVDLFRDLQDNHNYVIRKMTDTVYHLCFNPDTEIAGGPTFSIEKKDTAWIVTDVAFGK